MIKLYRIELLNSFKSSSVFYVLIFSNYMPFLALSASDLCWGTKISDKKATLAYYVTGGVRRCYQDRFETVDSEMCWHVEKLYLVLKTFWNIGGFSKWCTPCDS